MGVKKTGDFLEQATWGLAIALLVICLGMKAFSPGRNTEESAVQKQAENSSMPSPASGSAAPATSLPGVTQRTSPAAVPSQQPANSSPKK